MCVLLKMQSNKIDKNRLTVVVPRTAKTEGSPSTIRQHWNNK